MNDIHYDRLNKVGNWYPLEYDNEEDNMPINVRKKGHDYERQVANEFVALGWSNAKRHLEYQSSEAEAGQDLDNTDPFLIQCKCGRHLPAPLNILDQIKNCPGKYKLGMVKNTSKGEYIIMHKKEFYELLMKLKVEQIF
jgi:hypothetical protein